MCILFTGSLSKPKTAEWDANSGKNSSSWKCMINYFHKYLLEHTHKADALAFYHMRYNKNIVSFLLFQKYKAFYLRIK